MKNIRFIKQPGFVFDLFFLFTLRFNKEYCLSNFINYNKANEDSDYFKNLLNDFSPISDDLLLFFYLTDEKKCFMTYSYFEPHILKFFDGSYDLSSILEDLSNHEQVVKNIIKFYFKEVSEKTLEESQTSMPALNKLIKESKYSGDIKSALYSFFIDPAPIIRKLSYELMEKDFSLSKKYETNTKFLFKLQDMLDFDSLAAKLKQHNDQTINLEHFENVCVSFCLINKNTVKTTFDDNLVNILLGFDYEDFVEYLSAQIQPPELEAFGNAVSETNRINVLDLILERGEITIKDLEQEFGFTGTNAYYHLSLMIKAGMLKTRNRGRTVLYSINKNYFQVLCDILGKYYKS